ncbi:hypothetical protein Hanom_Chr11g01044011 [Helianthus anomalus]
MHRPKIDITSFAWCTYMTTCLNRMTKAWKRKHDESFRGPIVLVAVCHFTL